jgi:hypothetical protein
MSVIDLYLILVQLWVKRHNAKLSYILTGIHTTLKSSDLWDRLNMIIPERVQVIDPKNPPPPWTAVLTMVIQPRINSPSIKKPSWTRKPVKS